MACLRAIARALDGARVTWAVRGAPGELLRWCRDRSPKDLDLWAPQSDAESVVALLIQSGGIPTCARRGVAGRPGIGSAMFMFVDENGRPIGTLDVSFGAPRAGVVELGTESDHVRDIQRPAGFPCFTGAAVLTELVLRRCVRGKASDPAHILYARRCFRALPEQRRARFLEQVRERFRPPSARLLEQALGTSNGEFPWETLRRRLLSGACVARPRLLAELAVDKALFDRRPRERLRYPGGSRPSGTTIAVVGTDGTGKSSVVAALRNALGNFGLGAQDLYFGRVRGSALFSDSMRKRLESVTRATSIEDTTASARRVSGNQRALRYLASYVYVVDYTARLVLRVLPLWARGNVIIFDRYVYDLRIMPHGSALAARLAEVIAPRPRLLFFLDVDANVITSRRRERTLAEVVKQQAILREACARIGAGTRYLQVDSRASVNELAQQMARAAIATAHRREIGVSRILGELLDDVARVLAQPPLGAAAASSLAEANG